MLIAILLYSTVVQAGPSPLIRAVQNKNIALVTKLVRGGVDLNATDISGRNALHYTIRQDNRQILELLLAEGANPKLKDTDGNTPFNLAVTNEQPALAAILLKAMVGINGRDDKSWSPLYWAILADDWQLVQELLRDGADVAVGRHQNAFDIAKIMGTEAKLAAILAKERGINAAHKVLVKAMREGNTDTVKLLLELGADINAKNNYGWTALIYAARWGNTDTVKLLLELGADINAKNNYGWTALIYAARWGNTDTVKLLLELGADINAKNNYRWTALIYAARWGKTEIVKLLLDRKANIEAKDNHGWTALMIAARWGKTEIVKLLLDRKANIEAKNDYGSTALMIAARWGNTEIVKLLLDRKANIEAKDNFGWTALMIAETWPNKKIVKLLQDAL